MLVTRDSVQDLLNTRDPVQVVGRALVALLQYQTKSEQEWATTDQDNGVGFTGADAYSATLTAKYFIKHGTLQDWQVAKWTKPGKNGYARLAKYWKQLNTVAEAKAQQH